MGQRKFHQQLFERGREFLEMGDFERAQIAFRDCLEQEVRSKEARIYIAETNVNKLKNLLERMIEALLERSREDPLLKLIEGQLHLLRIPPEI